MKRTVCMLLMVLGMLSACTPASEPTPHSTLPPLTVTAPPPAEPTPTLPFWLDSDPNNGKVSQTSPIILHFAEPMDTSNNKPLAFTPPIEGKFTWMDNQAVQFTPKNGWRKGVTYRLRPHPTLRTANGNVLFVKSDLQITIVAKPIVQEAKLNIFEKYSSVVIKFSEAMDAQSVENSLSITEGAVDRIMWDIDNTRLEIRFKPNAWVPDTKFQVSISAEAKAQKSHEPLQPFKQDLTTPALSANWTENFVLAGKFQWKIQLNYDLDVTSLAEAIQIQPQVAVEISAESARVFLISAAEPLKLDTEYRIILGKNAKLHNGKRIGKDLHHLTRTTQPILRWGNITLGEKPPALRLNSSLPIDKTWFAENFQISPAFDYELVWNERESNVMIQPLDFLPPEQIYRIRFTNDQMIFNHWKPYTLPTPETEWKTPPAMVIGDTQELATGSPLVLNFDRPIQAEQSLDALIQISPPTKVQYRWVTAKKLEIFPENGLWKPQTLYTVKVSPSIQSESGKTFLPSEQIWELMTGDFLETATFGEYGANYQTIDLDGRRAVQLAVLNRVSQVRLSLYRLTPKQFIAMEQQTPDNTSESRWWYGFSREAIKLDTRALPLQISYQTEVHQSADSDQDSNYSEVILPADLPEGMYVLNLETSYLEDQLLLVVSRSSVQVKFAPNSQVEQASGGDLLVWVNNTNSHVMKDVAISVYDAQGQVIQTGVTDGVGVFQTNIPAGKTPYFVTAQRGDSIGASGLGHHWQMGRYYRNINDSSNVAHKNRYFAYLYPDRPIYRSGQKVAFKGIVRRDNDAQYSLVPAGMSANLEIRDPRNNLISQTPVILSDFGTFDGSFQLIEDAMLGNYQMVLVFANGEQVSQTFTVEDFSKPEIQLSVIPDKSSYLAGDTMSVRVNAQYLFGEPVANSSIQVKLYFKPLIDSDYYYFYSDRYIEYLKNSWEIAREQTFRATTDAEGNAVLQIPAVVNYRAYTDYFGYYYRNLDESSKNQLAIEASITEPDSGNSVSSSTTVHVFPSAYQVQLTIPKSYDWEDGEEVPVAVKLSSTFGKPLEGQAVIVELINYWRGYQNETVVVTTLPTDANGKVITTLKIPDSSYGAFMIRAYLQETDGVFDSQIIYTNSYWQDDSSGNLAILSADKPDYQAGQMATLRVFSDHEREALLTIERGSIFENRMVKLESPFSEIEIPILAEYSPNIYVTLQAWNALDTTLHPEGQYESLQDSQLLESSISLSVSENAHKLKLAITSNRESYAPRDTASFEIQVTDAQGRPVLAELSLALVDEALFLLKDDPAGEIYSTFYKERAMDVKNFHSFMPYRQIWGPDGQGGGGGGGSFDAGNPRADFPDAVLWLPNVRTNANGVAVVQVELPDNLTTWRLTAKGITRQSQMGEASAKIVTQQSLVIRPFLPSQIHVGDALTLAAQVGNYSDNPVQLTVELQQTGLQISSPTQHPLTLAAGETQLVTWQAQATAASTAIINISAKTDGEMSDAVERQIPVTFLQTEQFTQQNGRIWDSVTHAIDLPANRLPGSQLQLEIGADASASLLNGLTYLAGYPHGCVEQTMSKALPNAVLLNAFTQLGLEQNLPTEPNLSNLVAKSVQRLYGFQHNDGGWGWWFDDLSHDYQTAWVVFGLQISRSAGALVDEQVIARGKYYLLATFDKMDANTQAFALYALSQTDIAPTAPNNNYDSEYYDDISAEIAPLAHKLLSSKDTLNEFAKLNLALSLWQLGEHESAKQLLQAVLATAQTPTSNTLYIKTDLADGSYSKKTMASDVRSTALLLQALVTILPGQPESEFVLNWLMEQREFDGWGTTNETAYAILGITAHLLKNKVTVAGDVQIEWDNTLLTTLTLSPTSSGQRWTLDISKETEEKHQLRLINLTGKNLFYSLGQANLLRADALPASGISITRQYLLPNGKEPTQPFAVGDAVLVQLELLAKEPGVYVMIEDPLPGGLQAVQSGLNIASFDERQAYLDYFNNYDRFDWFGQYDYNYKQIRASAVSFFITDLHSGKLVLQYLARAVVAGDFAVAPTTLEGMYHPEFRGNGDSQTLKIVSP